MILGIGGGTGSGKTTLAARLSQALGPDQAIWLAQDAYYRDSSHLPLDERVRQNFDHPNAVDFDLLIRHAEALPEPPTCPAARLLDSHAPLVHENQENQHQRQPGSESAPLKGQSLWGRPVRERRTVVNVGN